MHDKEGMAELIRASDTDWIIVRPAILTGGPRTGVGREANWRLAAINRGGR
jgi:hypothetical protein